MILQLGFWLIIVLLVCWQWPSCITVVSTSMNSLELSLYWSKGFYVYLDFSFSFINYFIIKVFRFIMFIACMNMFSFMFVLVDACMIIVTHDHKYNNTIVAQGALMEVNTKASGRQTIFLLCLPWYWTLEPFEPITWNKLEHSSDSADVRQIKQLEQHWHWQLHSRLSLVSGVVRFKE